MLQYSIEYITGDSCLFSLSPVQLFFIQISLTGFFLSFVPLSTMMDRATRPIVRRLRNERLAIYFIRFLQGFARL